MDQPLCLKQLEIVFLAVEKKSQWLNSLDIKDDIDWQGTKN